MSAEPTDSHAKDAARHRELARLRDEAIARLEGDPAVQEWLAQFQDGDSFLTYYAERRADYLTYGPDWQRHFERQARADAAAGLDRLWQIQQRKLFRAQCQWRAEELMLPAKWVEVSRDFDIWGERIHECPFLDPITPEEVEQYAAYLHSDECEDTDPDVMPVLIWQFYAKYRIWREAEERGDDPVEAVLGPKPADVPDFLHYGTLSVWRYPEWYIWADDHLPEPNWLYLPDRRGAKEAYYEQLASQQADHAPNPPVVAGAAPPATTGPLPFRRLAPDDPTLTETLLRRFEPPETLQYYRALDYGTTKRKKHGKLSHRVRRAVEDLEAVEELVPIRAAPDWREAVVAAWRHYQRERVARAVRAAYTAYQERERAGQPHPPGSNRRGGAERYADEQRAAILRGRQLAGEPADFNF